MHMYASKFWQKINIFLFFFSVLSYAGRPSSASPATGNKQMHYRELEKMMNDAMKF
jgi:2-oxoglutarate dehydrogenase complex dehydrogenase (E1) component-like enzyme